MIEKNKKIVALIVLDGWGYREEKTNNAIASAHKPFFDSLWTEYPHSLLSASGPAVGLPEGQIGNSEVGHMTIGAGQITDTDLVRISKAIQDGEFKNIPAFTKLFEHLKQYNSTLHIMGLIGPGGVHSYQEHLMAFLQSAKTAGLKKIAIHAFMDGRDLAPQSGATYLEEINQKLIELGIGHIATVTGRYYAMDRDSNWNRLDLALSAITKGQGEIIKNISPAEAVRQKYKNNEVDELLKPMVFLTKDEQPTMLEKNDGIFIFNFRADRIRMITKKLKEQKDELNLDIVTMTEYEQDLNLPVAFPPIKIDNTLAKEISLAGLTQAHIAETEKFAHATYFLNGGVEQAYPNENQILISSHKDVATHDQAPEMRAKEITDKALEQIELGTDFLFINYANADMVGHTANVPAIIKAIETLDEQLRRLIEKIEEVKGIAIITADHGNAELNINPETGKPHTAHTTNPVPLIITDKNIKIISGGTLVNLAGTILKLLNIKAPANMASSLIDPE